MNADVSNIFQALFWGSVSVTGILIGTIIGSFLPLGHRIIATIMAIAAGLLLAAATVELAVDALDVVAIPLGIGALLVGAISFSWGNASLSKRGAKDRKRCGDCVSQPMEEENPGSGFAIALGTMMDAIPEALVLGLTLRLHGPDGALIAAIALGNLPEAISGSAGMLMAKRPVKWILSIWFGVAIVTVILTVLGYVLAGSLTPDIAAALQLFGSGALLAMITETLIPEAVHDTPRFAGAIAAIGFALLLLLGVFL